MQPSRFYLGLIGFFLAALVFAALYFVTGMNEASYLVNDGAGYGLRYLDLPSYNANMQGLIFVLSFLAAGFLLLLLIILPNQEGAFASAQAAPPQPRRRAAQPAAPAPQPVAAQPVVAPQPAAAPQAVESSPAPAAQATSEAPVEAAPAEPAPRSGPPKAVPERSVEEEVATTEAPADLDIDDLPESRYDDTGNEDVVYGNGRVSDDSVWDFIHSYPDSAVKFLYRKSLENKPLTPSAF